MRIAEDLSTTSGAQSVCGATQRKVALRQGMQYICSANQWWQNGLRSAAPGVPLRRERVVQLGRHLFRIDTVDPEG